MDLPQTPSFRLDGRRALVTGAGRGLGLAMASALAEAGAHVVLVARTEAEISAAAAAIVAKGQSATAIPCDLTDIAAFEAMLAAHGPFHAFCNNAGTNQPQHIFDVTEDAYDTVMNINVRSALFAAKAVAAQMVEHGIEGSIINTSSQMGHVSGPKRAVYSASKHAVEGFTKGMAWELGRHNIRVNTICPTFILTEMTRSTFEDPEMRKMMEEKIAFGRVGQIEDVMGAVLFLASDASRLVTGSALMIDGGWTAV